MRRSVEAVRELYEIAAEDQSEAIYIIATSAVRDAANGGEFTDACRDATGVPVEILTGEEEAACSYFGASRGGVSGVIDIGGGSTEIIIGNGVNLSSSFSCQMGAVRLSRLYPLQSCLEMTAVIDASSRILEEKLSTLPALLPAPAWYGTGGTFTTLAAMVNGVPWTDRTHMHGTKLTCQQIEKEASLLAPMSPEERKLLPGLQPNRADIIVHGICILIACMRTLQIPEITVSEYGNLDGFLKYHYQLVELF